MDALSDVLRAVRLSGAVLFDILASDPWVAETPQGGSIVSAMFPGTEHLITYHVILQGNCWATVLGEAPIRLSPGDVIVFPHGDAHGLSSAPGVRGTANIALYRASAHSQLPFSLSMGKPGPDPTRIVCGFLGCDARPFNPLLNALPRVIRVSDQAGGALGAYVRFAVAESKTRRIGSECVLGRLSELMFVDVVRRYLETLPPDRADWLAGLRDPFIGRALAALHRSPAQAWTLESLAREAALSRSTMVERFTQFVGLPPMQYLMSWRMQLAAIQLRSGTDSVVAIANRVGYESEAAVSRAFKKAVGTPPSQWRKQRAAKLTADLKGSDEQMSFQTNDGASFRSTAQ